MPDPTFATRRELVAWARETAVRALFLPPDARMRVLDEIRRVTLAHLHLED